MRCDPVSEGCANCWHLRMCKRMAGNPKFKKEERAVYKGGKFLLRSEELDAPLRLKKPARIGVQFMGDLFHEDVPFQMIRDIFRVMMKNNRHTYIILTKRPERLKKWMGVNYDPETSHRFIKNYPNIWFGITAENQIHADERIPVLLSIPAAKHFVSVEPMLGQVDLEVYLQRFACDTRDFKTNVIVPKGTRIDWVIAGPETGSGARSCCTNTQNFVNDLYWQCDAAGVPFFDKRKTVWIERRWPR